MAEQENKQQQKSKGGKPSPEEIAARKAAKARPKSQQEDAGAEEAPAAPAPPPRLIAHYREKIVPQLQQKFGYKNLLAVPRLEKIVISMGLGKAVTSGEKGKLEQAEKELAVIAGQKPVRCKAKKSVANFKVRAGMETGLKVTLRGARMYEFLDRMITLAIPRVKDFRGLEPNAFDNKGNYNFGFTEQTVFPEVDAAAVTFQQGMNITVVTTAKTPEEGRELLRGFGFPFREREAQGKKEGK
ncbi:50S ribosomal protein L5 [Fontivita pretiosa]|uniref:50S ribosomal protein L5 n=1 Tax=Fontivita pretiosa TaxID=2989684 RepID=UPI003D1775BD